MGPVSKTPCRELNNALEREGDGLVANRGLVPAETANKKLSENQVGVHRVHAARAAACTCMPAAARDVLCRCWDV
jgi:hypothetical protein